MRNSLKNFFTQQEKPITFTKLIDPDGDRPTRGEPVSVYGIASYGVNVLNPNEATEVNKSSVRIFLGVEAMTAVQTYVVGDIVAVEGLEYAVSKVDFRGVLPGDYVARVEGVRS